MRFVLDNSVVMGWLFGAGTAQQRAYAARILALLTQPDHLALVPASWALEVGQAIVRAEAKGLLQEARSAAFVGILGEMAIEVDAGANGRALGDILQLARRHRLSTYSASYLELALRQDLPLASHDEALNQAMCGVGGQLV